MSVETRIRDLGNTIVGSSPAQFGAFMKAERDKYVRVASVLGIKEQ